MPFILLLLDTEACGAEYKNSRSGLGLARRHIDHTHDRVRNVGTDPNELLLAIRGVNKALRTYPATVRRAAPKPANASDAGGVGPDGLARRKASKRAESLIFPEL
jgi:hypothetical protein